MELISKRDLYNRAVKLEQKALNDLKQTTSDKPEDLFSISVALMERTAFKHEIMDAPTIIEMPDTGIGDLSDGYHTFNGLYEQRAILFAALVKAYKDKSWKSHRHEDGEYCFGGGWFIVGIDTPEGSYTYHYENRYWDMFDCVDLPRAKHWDGHTEADAETRLMSLKPVRKKGWWQEITASDCSGYDPTLAGYDDPVVGCICSVCREGYEKELMGEVCWNFCPHCGANMRGEQDG